MASRHTDSELTLDPAVWRTATEMAEAASDSIPAPTMYQRIMDALRGLVAFDIGAIQSSAPGERWVTAAEIGDTSILRENNWRYAQEITREELRAFSSGFAVDLDVLSARRRDRLSIYHDFVWPNRQAACIVRYLAMDGRVWSLAIGRGSPSFSERSQAQLELLFPHLRAALRAVTARADVERVDGVGSLGAAWALTAAQARVALYVLRGLTNKETAGLLGLSPHTVRNTLFEVFKKVGVSRRSELAFLLSSASASGTTPSSHRDLKRQRQVMTTVMTRKTP